MDHKTQQDKHQCLRDLREAVERLERELADDAALSASEQAAQHDAIDRLDEHFNAVENRFASLREFWKALRSELAGARSSVDRGAK